MARHVYWRSHELADKTPRTLHLLPAMIWLGQLAQLQRACLALCTFGGHTHRETAALLGVPPMTVAELLTAGLREVGRLVTSNAATSAKRVLSCVRAPRQVRHTAAEATEAAPVRACLVAAAASGSRR